MIRNLVFFLSVLIITCSGMAVNTMAGEPKIILAFGDSLMAGYGVPKNESFPSQLERQLLMHGHNVRVINSGVSGDTTSGGRARLAFVLDQQKPDAVILALGANDMLRAIDPEITRINLKEMLDFLKQKHLPVLLIGMRAAPNFGLSFERSYNALYADLARTQNVLFYPFFLEGVAAQKDLLQDDGLHPNIHGIAVMVKNTAPLAEKLIKKIKK